MNKRILIPIVALVLVAIAGFAAYTLTKKKPPKPKVDGTVYTLPQQFTINLNDGQYTALTVALLLPPGETAAQLTEEPVIRAIITNDITDQPENKLLTTSGRHKLQAKILQDIRKQTDEKVSAIYFPDMAVQ